MIESTHRRRLPRFRPSSNPLAGGVTSVLLAVCLWAVPAELRVNAAAAGTVVAWGRNHAGQTVGPVGLSGVVAIAAGANHTVALKNDGTVVAWGENDSGGTVVPVGLSGVTAIAAGDFHTVALKNDGTVVTWAGRVEVLPGLSGVTAIAATAHYTAALKVDGTVVVWGFSGYGQTTVPVGLRGVTAIAAGGRHTVALKSDGTVVAWGDNEYGQTNVPTGTSGVTTVAGGYYHTVASKSDGTVVAWGLNPFGQTTVPAGLSGVTAVAAGYYHTVALKSDGTVVAWGLSSYGQTTVPVGLSGVTAIASGYYHTVALVGGGVLLPSITAQPKSLSVNTTSNAVFSVGVTSPAPTSYQWSKNGTAISGATNGTLILNSVQVTDAGSYTVVVNNVAGSTTSNAATLTLNILAMINMQPASQAITAGRTATFTVAATGTAPFTYQWRKDGTIISGATSGTLTLNSAQLGDAGSYTVVVGNAAGNTTSNAATLTVSVPTTISNQPVSQIVNIGANITFIVVATGTAPLSYQWRKDGTPIVAATSGTLNLSSVRSTDAGSYTVVVTNPAGSSTSNAAILSVNLPGRLINLSVLTDIAAAGDDFTLGYVVGGSGTLGPKTLVIRAAGPSLGALGVPGTLDDPKLELFAGSTSTGGNDNWGGSPQLTAALAAVGAFSYTDPFTKDAATTANITTRDNSVKVSAVGSGTGKIIAEIYDATSAASFTTATPRLINVSVRKNLGSGLTMGFVVGGATSAQVLVRGIGPTLGAFGVSGTVIDPQLTLFNSSSVKIRENNDWAGTAELTAAFASVGAFALPVTSKDAAILVTLAPGNYTAQVTGVNGTTGVALVEVYEVP